MRKISEKLYGDHFLKNKSITIAAWLLVGATLAGVYIGLVEGKFSRFHNFYSADILYLPALYNDLASGRGAVGWEPPTVPFLFPDFPIYAVIQVLLGNFHLSIVFFGVIQYILFTIGLVMISNQVFGRRPQIHFLVLIAAIFTGLLFIMADGNFSALMPVFISAFHFGAFLSAIFSLYLVLKMLRTGPGLTVTYGVQSGVLFLIAFLAIASDALFLVHFLVPALFGLWLLLLTARISSRQLFYFYVTLVPAAPLGYWLNRALMIYRFDRPQNELSLKTIADNVVRAKQGLILAWTQGQWFPKAMVPWFTLIWILFILLTVFISIRLLFSRAGRRPKKPRPRGRHFFVAAISSGLSVSVLFILLFEHGYVFWGLFALTAGFLWKFSKIEEMPETGEESNTLYLMMFFLSMLLVAVGSYLVSGVRPHARYFLPALLVPLFFGWPFLLASLKTFMKIWDCFWVRLGALLILSVLVLQFASLMKLPQLNKLSDFYPETIRRLDEFAAKNKISNGIANYELARPITMLSKKNLLIVQAEPDLSIHHWINNLNDYNRRFDFIITDAQVGNTLCIHSQWVEKKFGKPAKTHTSRDFKVMVYNRPQDSAFRDQYQKMFNFYFSGAQLAAETGHNLGFARIARKGSDKKGCLAKSPPLSLPIGDYQFRIDYFAEQKDKSGLGSWTVSLFPEQEETIVLAGGKMDPAGKRMISKLISIRQKGLIEIRVYYPGTGTLRIDAMRVTRIN